VATKTDTKKNLFFIIELFLSARSAREQRHSILPSRSRRLKVVFLN
jgi:hypothetical protein